MVQLDCRQASLSFVLSRRSHAKAEAEKPARRLIFTGTTGADGWRVEFTYEGWGWTKAVQADNFFWRLNPLALSLNTGRIGGLWLGSERSSAW